MSENSRDDEQGLEDLYSPAGEQQRRTDPSPATPSPPDVDAEPADAPEATQGAALSLGDPNATVSSDEGKPLDEMILEQALARGSVAPAPAPAAGAAGSPGALARTHPGPSNRGENDAHLAAMHRRVLDLQHTLGEQETRSRFRTALFGAVGLVLGLVAGLAYGLGAEPPPPVPLNVALVLQTAERIPLETRAKEALERKNPSKEDVADGKTYLLLAEKKLLLGKFAEAQENLLLCTEIANLAECHKRLGAILALKNDPISRAHLEAYARLRPGAPDAAQIRTLLDLRDE